MQEVNSFSDAEFHKIFENVIELWSQAAVFCSAIRPFQTSEALIKAFVNYLDRLPLDLKLKVLRLHPDLAGKLANEQDDDDDEGLTEESKFEQSTVGLNKLNVNQKEELKRLNEEYKLKFGFPFIICVREAKKLEIILEAMKERVKNDEETEITAGIEEVKKICRLRILQIVQE